MLGVRVVRLAPRVSRLCSASAVTSQLAPLGTRSFWKWSSSKPKNGAPGSKSPGSKSAAGDAAGVGSNVGLALGGDKDDKGSKDVVIPNQTLQLQLQLQEDPTSLVKRLGFFRTTALVLRKCFPDFRERRLLAGGLVFCFASASITLYMPNLIGDLVDQSVGGTLTYPTSLIAASLFGIYCFQFCMTTSQVACIDVAGEICAMKLRKRVFEKILRQDSKFFDFNKTGDLVNRLSSDIHLVKSNFTNNFDDGLYGMVFVTGATGMLFYISPTLAATCLSVYPCVVLLNYTIGRILSRYQNTLQRILGRANDVSTEVISELTTVRQFCAEKREIARYSRVIDESFVTGRRMAITTAIFDGFSEFGGNMSLLCVLVFGASEVLSGRISVGELTSFLVYSFSLATYFTDVTTFGASFMKGLGAATRVIHVLDQAEVIESSGNRMLPYFKGNVKFENVDFAYPLRENSLILQNLNFELEAGKSVAIVGGSGCGKSTISRLLTRLYDTNSGKILVDGVDLKELDIEWLRSRIGVVSQEPALMALSLRDNIRYGRPEATDEEIIEAAKLAHAHEFITQFPEGYDTLVGEHGAQLSGGQKQRVAIARLILKNPSIVILDEATSALDAENESYVMQSLKQLLKGRTSFIITHSPETMKLADMVAVMNKGRIESFGTFEELSKNSPYFRHFTKNSFSS